MNSSAELIIPFLGSQSTLHVHTKGTRGTWIVLWLFTRLPLSLTGEILEVRN